jgi:hypothetical protein
MALGVHSRLVSCVFRSQVTDGLTTISLLEGLLTCVVAIAWYFFLPDFPEEATFLTPEERIIVRRRLAADVGNSAHHVKYTWRDTLGVFRDCKFSSSYCPFDNNS